jgi:hypothetical protein
MAKAEPLTKQEVETIVRQEINTQGLVNKLTANASYASVSHGHREFDDFASYSDLEDATKNLVKKADISQAVKDAIGKKLKLFFLNQWFGLLILVGGLLLFTRAMWFIHPGFGFAFLGLALFICGIVGIGESK